MCLLIAKPKDTKVNWDIVESASITNNDGFGYAYAKDGEIHRFRTMDFKEFEDRYHKEGVDEYPALIHLRLSTGGQDNVKNCHPFFVGSRNLVMGHNGVFAFLQDQKKKSDTNILSGMLARLPKGWENDADWLGFVESAIMPSKIALMDPEGNIKILNEEAGVEEDGVWYSNKSCVYSSRRKYSTTPSYGLGFRSGTSGGVGVGGYKYSTPLSMSRSTSRWSTEKGGWVCYYCEKEWGDCACGCAECGRNIHYCDCSVRRPVKDMYDLQTMTAEETAELVEDAALEWPDPWSGYGGYGD